MQATVSDKGQLVIPVHLRRRLRIEKRSKVEIEEREGALIVRPVGNLEELNRRRLAEATAAVRASAAASGASKLSPKQIDALIRKTRKERRQRFAS